MGRSGDGADDLDEMAHLILGQVTGEVRLADHADEAVIVDDRQSADLVLFHDLKDLAARCVLHETDHCDGIVFLDRMSALKRQLAKRKIKALQKTGKWE